MGDHVVVSDNFSRLHHEETLEYKSVVSILPITAIDHNDEQKAIALNGNVVVQQLIAFDERHVVAMCIQRPPPDAVDNLDGHWFGPDQTADKSIVAVLIHIAAGREIERVTVVHHMGQYTEDAPEPRTEVVAYDGQVGLALDWMGVVMAGQRTRDVIAANARDYHESGKATKKKKKKGLRKSGAKKDGFARGMSLRG
uniref:Uncharacterized protein n=1 Tax=Craspedostauros australis TaxID=1486917 RepID=A0A7R9WMP7_9STRA